MLIILYYIECFLKVASSCGRVRVFADIGNSIQLSLGSFDWHRCSREHTFPIGWKGAGRPTTHRHRPLRSQLCRLWSLFLLLDSMSGVRHPLRKLKDLRCYVQLATLRSRHPAEYRLPPQHYMCRSNSGLYLHRSLPSNTHQSICCRSQKWELQ